MSIAIRPGTSADVARIAGFNAAMAAESEDKGLDLAVLTQGVRYLMDNPREGYYLMAEVEGEAAGTLMVTFEWSDWRNGRFWWIQSVYVAPHFRRLGVYRAMHQAVSDAAHQDPQACGIRLYVERENTGAQATYKTIGMVETHYRLYEQTF
ncbi:MAG: GNAT family N-acetyltransferase [Proteobacteria bacterium]|nr:GNAT family N-acetyltransferase [Pseudomonadota bacterium]